MNEAPEVHYAAITRDKYVVFVKRGSDVVEIGWPTTELKAELMASALSMMLAVVTDTYPVVDPIRDDNPPRIGIIGRERVLMQLAANAVHNGTWKEFEATKLRETPRGYYFDAKITAKGETTGRVARITIELDRVEQT